MKLRIIYDPEETFRHYVLQEMQENIDVFTHGKFRTEKAARREANRLLKAAPLADYKGEIRLIWESP